MVERPIQISEASGKWRFQGPKGNLPPIRSGSAPPSIEGSFAAIENLMSRNSIRVDHSNLSTHKEESGDIRSPKQELSAEAGIADSNPTTTSVSSSPSLDGTEGNMVLKPPMSTRSNTRSQDHGSASGVADAAVSAVRHEMDSLNISNFPKLESEVVHAGPHSQTVPLPQTYVGTDQFLQNPILPSLGFGYMTAETSMYPNIMAAGYIPQQFAIGGYAFNLPPMSPYETGYLFPNPYPTPFGNMVPGFSGQSQTSGVNLQHLNNFYAHFGLPSWEQQILQSLGGVGHVNLNSGSVGTVNPYYLGSPTNIDFLQFLNSPVASPLMPGSPIGGVSYPGRRNESGYGGWRGHNGNYAVKDPKTNSLLDELKSGKGRRLELSEIYGHIVEFSVDQYGSRFIQQKLEICSNEERESIFKEVLPHASKLITDVFGNYVIQKIFEYGNAEQRREFGSHLEGQILSLSLHVYGCRVIQKALEAFDLEQKIKIAHELEEHVLKCVCDQNGNHVIQKCIECLPTENVKILISSFRGRVESVSKHPFGCRVIQRVLECSKDELQTQFIVDEILDSVYGLAQDQYGNYVAQYVLGARTPEERSQIVHKLAGHVVRLSQHKFASNVIEKCLEFGDEAARQLMIKEITESTDGNDNLLVLVKDQYANYVVQKVLQVCSGHKRESLLGRIKIHLNLLKKYTYGKHIVARFEQFYGEEIEAPGSTLQQPKSDGNRQSL